MSASSSSSFPGELVSASAAVESGVSVRIRLVDRQARNEEASIRIGRKQGEGEEEEDQDPPRARKQVVERNRITSRTPDSSLCRRFLFIVCEGDLSKREKRSSSSSPSVRRRPSLSLGGCVFYRGAATAADKKIDSVPGSIRPHEHTGTN